MKKERRWNLRVLRTPLASSSFLPSALRRLQVNWPSENQVFAAHVEKRSCVAAPTRTTGGTG
eukprot:9149546-Pyramimonas_sp.AAC.1